MRFKELSLEKTKDPARKIKIFTSFLQVPLVSSCCSKNGEKGNKLLKRYHNQVIGF